MGVTYIIGRSGTGKTFQILNELQNKLIEKNERKLILLVPEQYTLQAERDLIQQLDVEGIISAEVLSFTRLAYYVFKEVGGLTKVKIDNLGKSMVLKRIVNELERDLTIYKKAIKQNGFIDKLNDLIKEFKQYDIAPYDLINNIDRLDENTLKFKLQDMALIYSAFNGYLKGKYIDNEDHINLLIESIEKASFLDEAEVWIDGFHQFTPQTLRIIEKLILKCKNVSVALTYDIKNEANLFFLTQRTLFKLRDIAKQHNIDEKFVDLNQNTNIVGIRNQEIDHLEKNLYKYPYKPYLNKVNNIHIFAGSNLYSEVEKVATEVIRLLRDHQYRYKDIAIVAANIKGYGPLIKRVFDEYDIPFFIDEKRDIMSNPIIEVILASLRIVYKGYQYVDVISFLKTGFSSLTKSEIEEIENYVLQFGIKGSLWFKDFTIDLNKNLDEINVIRKKVVEPFIELEKSIKGNKTVTEITEALFYFIDRLRIKEQLEIWINKQKSIGQYDSAHENSQIWNIVMEVFNQLSEILGKNEIKLKEYYKVLESGFMACEVGVIPSTIDQVLIGNIERSRSQNIRALFVLGINDGVLPSVQDEDGILLDHEKQYLQDNGVFLSSNSDSKIVEERFTIYTVLTKPTQYLHMSYAIADQEGRALRPSILIDQFKKTFPLLEPKSDLILNNDQEIQLVSRDRSTFKYLVHNLRKYADMERIHEIWWEVYKWYCSSEKWKEKIDKTIAALFHENQVYYLKGNQSKLIYDKPIKASVSRLETYINCPFAHFVQYGLKAKERREYQLRIPDIGKLYHDVIDHFAKKIKEDGLDWHEITEEQCHNNIEQIVQEISVKFENGVLYSTHKYRYLITRLNRICKRAIWTMIEHIKMGDFKPWGHEVYFGETGEISAVEIELNDEVIFLEGRIDRVDFFEDETGVYYKVVDYKSGEKEFNLSDVYFGFQLQLMIYLEAMISGAKSANYDIKPGGILYYKIDDPMISSNETNAEQIIKEINKKLKMKGLVLNDPKIIKSLHKDIEKHSTIIPVSLNTNGEVSKNSSVATEEEFKVLLKHVRNLVKQASQEIVDGHIKIDPCKKGKTTTCIYCNFKTICQFDKSFNDNKYRIIKELKNEEVIEKLVRTKEGDEDVQLD
ncbi:helicase-exonuclease AddAB subunit AddB [Serpentinicella alkaliphila]|uniref:ATP-dependent helicase/deoxyribonuclease subunit B n=1 Tax=Serpentinicella alkaliphila TaxID=1734049 RepID=A0A4R2TYP5_9FIRM|nr:helicase-exonuclease AddAB subunit AddB [Serpentinicella alkaliphila]QUH25644.1 helicase-exonuclease AddAB subunit AddB [Serpentinicella alkaliphila]TCQ06645.1 DNA helicase/exodeoxyribonuclease V subunit B [Serpentinicella alkaliphila]